MNITKKEYKTPVDCINEERANKAQQKDNECGCHDEREVETGSGMLYEPAEVCPKHREKKAQHTSVEWAIHEGSFYKGGYREIYSTKGKNPSIGEVKAEFAHLVASAPLMLKALESVLNMGDDYEAEKLVRQAIKKAKGE